MQSHLPHQIRAATLCAGLLTGLAAQDFQPGTFLQTNQVAGDASTFFTDLNGNGIQDVIFEDVGGLGGGFYTLLDPGMTSSTGTVTTSFQVSTVSPFGGFFEIAGIADMNADGFDDVVFELEVLFGGSTGVYYSPNDGLGGFGAAVPIVQTTNFTIATIGDFDGNGETDLALLTDSFGPTTSIYLQTSGTFTSSLMITASGRMVAGDFDGDGDDELAIISNGTLIVQPGGSTFGSLLSFPIDPSMDNGFAADLDGDGFEDCVLQSCCSAPWLVFALFGSPTTTLETPIDVIPGGVQEESNTIRPFDIDGDGRDELLGDLRMTTGYALIRHDGARNFSPMPLVTDMNGAIIDLDLDGDLDLLTPGTGGFQRRDNLGIYGDACAGGQGAPELLLESAIPGNAGFAMSIENAAPNAIAALFLSDAATPGPCGAQLDGMGLLPGLLTTTDGSGRADFPLPLPVSTPRGPYFLQGIVLDPAGAFGLGGLQLATTPGRALSVY